MKTSNSLTVKLRKSVATFHVPLVEEMDESVIVKSMNVGIEHPVIDEVGYLQRKL